VTRAQLAGLGLGRRTLDRWVAAGRLRTVHRNVYVFGPQPVTKRGKWLAGVLAMGAGAFLSHRSAAAFWGLAADDRKVHVTAPSGRQVRPGRNGIQVHPCKFEHDEVTVRDGIPVSTVARTLFDVAERSRTHELKNAWDEASRLRLLRVPEVARIYELRPGRRRARKSIRPLLQAEQRLIEPTDSPLEDRFAEFVVVHHLPAPQTNVLASQIRALLSAPYLTRSGDTRASPRPAGRGNAPPNEATSHGLDPLGRPSCATASGGGAFPRPPRNPSDYPRRVSTAIAAVSVGLSPTRTPLASSASFFAWAVPEEPEMIAPAWPICLPGGAVKPAM
jgi:hypothetical protein